jgi:hypothetical protein
MLKWPIPLLGGDISALLMMAYRLIFDRFLSALSSGTTQI